MKKFVLIVFGLGLGSLAQASINDVGSQCSSQN